MKNPDDGVHQPCHKQEEEETGMARIAPCEKEVEEYKIKEARRGKKDISFVFVARDRGGEKPGVHHENVHGQHEDVHAGVLDPALEK